jgi:hypothetical protein
LRDRLPDDARSKPEEDPHQLPLGCWFRKVHMTAAGADKLSAESGNSDSIVPKRFLNLCENLQAAI